MNENLKKEIENICDNFLKNFAEEYDFELSDGGGFSDKKNFYDWSEDIFEINFLSISQNDFLEKDNIFETLKTRLKIKLEEIIEIRNVFYEGDCPILYFKLK